MSKTSARPTITPGRRFFFAPTFFFSGSFAGSEKFSAKSKNSLRCWIRIKWKCASQYLGVFWRVFRCVLASGAGGCAVWLWLSLWAVCTHSKFCFPSWFLSRCPAPAAFVLFPRVHCRLSEMVSARDISRGAVLPACTIAGQTAAHRPARTAPRPLFRRVCPIQRQRNAISCHNIVFIFLQWATISHKKHGFQNIKGVFSHCAGAFLWEMTVYTAAPPANAGNFPLWPHSKFCFSVWFLAFFALQVVFVFVPLARFLDFRKCFHAHKWAGACFSLYDIGQTGATSHPLPDCAPQIRQGHPDSPPAQCPAGTHADGTQHAREYSQAPAKLKVRSRSLY